VVLFSGLQGSSAKPAPTRPPNKMETSAHDSKKTHNRESKAAATLYKKKQAKAAKVARQQATEEFAKAKKAKAEELATARALKKQQRNAATAEKSHDTPNRPKQKASHCFAKSLTKCCCVVAAASRVVAAASRVEAGPLPVSSPLKISMRGRQIKTPAKFK
jgi:hypothetical protein